MNINLNVPMTMMTRLIEAVEQLAADYATVHQAALDAARHDIPVGKGRVFYQSDKQYFEDELKAKEKGVEIV